jgi:hypothetical protein
VEGWEEIALVEECLAVWAEVLAVGVLAMVSQ